MQDTENIERGSIMAELWDAYDKNFNKIEKSTLVRGNSIPDDVYHLVVDVIVKHEDGTYLLMKRDYRKHYGGMWELTAGGSVLKGENSLEGAIRELKEETGISTKELKEIGKIVHDAHHSLYVEYLCVTDCKKDSIILQEGETIDYKWVDRKSLLEMSDDELVSARAMKLVKKLNL